MGAQDFRSHFAKQGNDDRHDDSADQIAGHATHFVQCYEAAHSGGEDHGKALQEDDK